MSNGRRPDPTGQIDVLGIPGADNRWFPSQGEARNAALAVANELGVGYTLAHDPQPRRGQPHYHIVSPTGQRVSGHFFYGRRLPRRVLRGRSARELEEELTQAEFELALGQSPEFMARRPLTPEERTARQRGAELVRDWVGELDKSNSSGTPVRPQAQIRAGNQLVQEANQIRANPPLQEAYRRHGRYLLGKGRQGLHKSQRGGRGAREWESQHEWLNEPYAEHLASFKLVEHDYVNWVKCSLNRNPKLRVRLGIDGRKGADYREAIRRFQAEKGLRVSGDVDAPTQLELIKENERDLNYVSWLKDVLAGLIRVRLIDPAGIALARDPIFTLGPETRKAVRRFQGVVNKANPALKIREDSVVGPKTEFLLTFLCLAFQRRGTMPGIACHPPCERLEV